MSAPGTPGRAGIIAAGRGERLRPGTGVLKPLVRVAGQPLIGRVLSSLAETGVSEIAIIVNEESTIVRQTVGSATWPFAIRWIVETTPSSMHSFLRVVETLARDGDPGPFLLSTVDTVASPGMYRAFASAAASLDADVVLAVNRPRPDDNPLLVRVEGLAKAGHDIESPAKGGHDIESPAKAGHYVLRIGESARQGDTGTLFATAGFYVVRPSVLQEADAARAEGLTALRFFLQRLLARGYRIAAVEVTDSVDVDRPEDVIAAESFLRSATT